MMKPAAKARGSRAAGKAAAQRYAAPALEKGLDILELFAAESTGLTKSEVARRLERTTSEVFRMLMCLQKRGYISQGEDERYRLTLRIFELAHLHPPTERLILEAIPVMHDIAHRTNQSCHLAVVDRGLVVILAQADAPLSTGFHVRPGSQVDLMSAASGYVILAFLPHHLQAKAMEEHRQRAGKVPRDLVAHIEKIRRVGYEKRASYQVEGVINISFPVLDRQGTAIAALTVPFLPRIDSPSSDAAVVHELRRGARALSIGMGYPSHSLGK